MRDVKTSKSSCVIGSDRGSGELVWLLYAAGRMDIGERDDEDGEEIAKNVSLVSFEGMHQRHMQCVPSAHGPNMV